MQNKDWIEMKVNCMCLCVVCSVYIVNTIHMIEMRSDEQYVNNCFYNLFKYPCIFLCMVVSVVILVISSGMDSLKKIFPIGRSH